jgi:hypothetical protein
MTSHEYLTGAIKGVTLVQGLERQGNKMTGKNLMQEH